MAYHSDVKRPDYVRNRGYISKLLAEAKPMWADHIADYLATRYLSESHALDNNIHWHPNCRHKIGDKETHAPAILASYYPIDDLGVLSSLPVTVLRHWPSLGDKMVMPPAGDMSAIVCPLGPYVREFLAVAEGIYTAMAYREILEKSTSHSFPVWSCYSADSMKNFIPPASVKRLHICMDVDISYTGQAAAYELAKRLRNLRPDLNIRVVRPCKDDGCDYDFNDWMIDRRKHEQEREVQGPGESQSAADVRPYGLDAAG